MLKIYEAGEKGPMKGPMEIEQSSSRKNMGLIQINLMIK
jgi:hypothetical protein